MFAAITLTLYVYKVGLVGIEVVVALSTQLKLITYSSA